jgi:hypothetical protein
MPQHLYGPHELTDVGLFGLKYFVSGLIKLYVCVAPTLQFLFQTPQTGCNTARALYDRT